MASNVYELNNSTDMNKLLEDLTGYRVIPESIVRNVPAVCCMCVYTNGSINVLAIKGTDTNNVSDLANDISMVLGGNQSRFGPKLTEIKALELIRKYNVNMVTGHSLGGYMAEIIATNHKLCGIAFCAPGSCGPATSLGGQEIIGFRNINFENDVAGNCMSGVYTHVQWSIFVKCDGYTHAMAVMRDYFKSRKSITNMNVVERSSGYPTGYYYPN